MVLATTGRARDDVEREFGSPPPPFPPRISSRPARLGRWLIRTGLVFDRRRIAFFLRRLFHKNLDYQCGSRTIRTGQPSCTRRSCRGSRPMKVTSTPARWPPARPRLDPASGSSAASASSPVHRAVGLYRMRLSEGTSTRAKARLAPSSDAKRPRRQSGQGTAQLVTDPPRFVQCARGEQAGAMLRFQQSPGQAARLRPKLSIRHDRHSVIRHAAK